MPIKLFTFDIPIDFVNTSGNTKQIIFVSSGNSDIVYDLNFIYYNKKILIQMKLH